jgi:hypothetical protein
MAADMNPGISPKTGSVINDVQAPNHDSGRRDMQKANSNNHQNEGQNVVYCDAHVEFQYSPYCGKGRTGLGAPPYRDHIYCSGTTSKDYGAGNPPLDPADSYCLPSDDANGI